MGAFNVLAIAVRPSIPTRPIPGIRSHFRLYTQSLHTNPQPTPIPSPAAVSGQQSNTLESGAPRIQNVCSDNLDFIDWDSPLPLPAMAAAYHS